MSTVTISKKATKKADPRKLKLEANDTVILPLCLGSCISEPTKGAVSELHCAKDKLNTARNAALEHWLIFRRTNPNWQPVQETSRGKPCVNKDGKPILESLWGGNRIQREMYHVAVAAAPEYNAQMLSTATAQAVETLTKKLPYNFHSLEKKKQSKQTGRKLSFRQYEAILNHELNITTFRDSRVPLASKDISLAYEGQAWNDRLINNKMVSDLSKGGCLLSFPLYSKNSGRENRMQCWRVRVRKLTPGHKRLLRMMVTGKWKIKDSQLVYKEGKNKKNRSGWFLHLCCNRAERDIQMDATRVATLTMLPRGSRFPFRIECADGKWDIGNLATVKYQFNRLENRRLTYRNRYKVSSSARKGHGVGKALTAIRKWSRAGLNIKKSFTRTMVADIKRFLLRYDCGKLVYHEPTVPLRQQSVLAEQGCDFDWTQFMSDLSGTMKNWRIEFEAFAMNGQAFNEKYPKRRIDSKTTVENTACVLEKVVTHTPPLGKPVSKVIPASTHRQRKRRTDRRVRDKIMAQ